MSRKIVSILALLCLLATSNLALAYNWSPNTTWHGGQGNNDWFSAPNWFVSATDPNKVPDINYQALIESKGPEPQIDGAATCGYLNIMPWSWTGENVEFTVDMNSGTFDVNYGISIGAWGNYDSSAGWGIPTFTVNGGTTTVITSPGDGILIGGGSDGLGLTQGKMYMYGGSVKSDRLEVRNGELDIYGGTLDCNTQAGFVLYQNLPGNKINANGGTLRVKGNITNVDPCTPQLIAAGRIVNIRGSGNPTATFDGTWTVITGPKDMNVAWNPTPAYKTTEVHFKHADGNYITLSWDQGDINSDDANFNVYFGSTLGSVSTATTASASFKGTRYDVNGDPCSWTINDVNFIPDQLYYWRIDEVNADNGVTKGKNWFFRTYDGKAQNPKPYVGKVALSIPLSLSWTPGEWATPTGGHHVYFSSTKGDLDYTISSRPTDARDRGIQDGNSYALSKLTQGTPFGQLVPNTTYYWAVDEVNGASVWKGFEWSFTTQAYVNIDDFQDYNTTTDVQTNWATTYETNCSFSTNSNGVVSLIQNATDGKFMNFLYRNNIGDVTYSETKLAYSPATSLTGSGFLAPAMAALSISFRGAANNSADIADMTYSPLYMALQDTAGNVAVCVHPDVNAVRATLWQQWFVSLADFNALGNPNPVQLASVSSFALGVGVRCNTFPTASDGNMSFDNIKLWASTCNPDFAHTNGLKLTADLDNDCDVDINDLDILANSWLTQAELLSYPGVTNPGAPVLWYKFNETAPAITVADSGSVGTYTGTVVNSASTNWDSTGGRSGGPCLNIPIMNPSGTTGSSTYIEADPNAVDFMTNVAHTTAMSVPGYSGIDGGGISFSVWINASLGGDELYQWPGVFGVWNSTNAAELVEVPCPSRIGPSGSGFVNGQAGFYEHTPGTGTIAGYTKLINFGGRWNHWAFVKAASNINGPYGSLRIYCNGALLASQDANGQAGDPNVGANGPLFPMPIGDIHIGTRGHNWAMWSGEMADFQIYDFALSDTDVQYLATDGTGSRLFPLTIRENLKVDGNPNTEIVNLKDLVIMCQQWHQVQLWP